MANSDLNDLLHNLRDYMEARADVDVDDFERPNQEMSFQNQIDEAIDFIQKTKDIQSLQKQIEQEFLEKTSGNFEALDLMVHVTSKGISYRVFAMCADHPQFTATGNTPDSAMKGLVEVMHEENPEDYPLPSEITVSL